MVARKAEPTLTEDQFMQVMATLQDIANQLKRIGDGLLNPRVIVGGSEFLPLHTNEDDDPQ